MTETEVLEAHRSFENDRPVFFIRIRASVDLHSLADAIRHANLVTDTSFISVDQVVNQVLEFLADFVQDSAHDR